MRDQCFDLARRLAQSASTPAPRATRVEARPASSQVHGKSSNSFAQIGVSRIVEQKLPRHSRDYVKAGFEYLSFVINAPKPV